MLRLIFAFLFIFPIFCFAHPHVFIKSHCGFVFNQKGLSGIIIEWKFDEMFSSVIFEDYDKNKDKKFNKSEINIIKKEAFSNLKNLNYLTYIKVGKKSTKINMIKNFKVWSENDNIFYSFFIPLNIKALIKKQTISVGQKDTTYYIDMVFADKNPMFIINAQKFNTHLSLKDNFEAYYDNPDLLPEEAVLIFNKKV